MQYIYDEENRRYIDCISNVQHGLPLMALEIRKCKLNKSGGFLVGHCHPTIVDAISSQLATSTCNIRFLSERLTECAEEILKTLSHKRLDTVLFCNSG